MKLSHTIGIITAELDTSKSVVHFSEHEWYSYTTDARGNITGQQGPFSKGLGFGKWDGQRIFGHTLVWPYNSLVKEFSDAFRAMPELALKIELAELLEKLPRLGPGHEKRARQALVEEVRALRRTLRGLSWLRNPTGGLAAWW